MRAVRRATIFLATLVVLLPCLPAGAHPARASRPGVMAGAGQIAEADWMDLKARTFYFATGWRMVDPDLGLVTLGFVGRGTCQVMHDGNFTIVSCAGTGRGHEIATEDFQFDPAMAGASLVLKQGGTTHTVDWTGEGTPSYGVSAGGAGTGVSAGGGTARWAPASGHLFGHHLDFSRDDFGVLVQDAGFGAFADGRTATYENGVLTLEVTYRIPR
jgi:hypothetical protein